MQLLMPTTQLLSPDLQSDVLCGKLTALSFLLLQQTLHSTALSFRLLQQILHTISNTSWFSTTCHLCLYQHGTLHSPMLLKLLCPSCACSDTVITNARRCTARQLTHPQLCHLRTRSALGGTVSQTSFRHWSSHSFWRQWPCCILAS